MDSAFHIFYIIFKDIILGFLYNNFFGLAKGNPNDEVSIEDYEKKLIKNKNKIIIINKIIFLIVNVIPILMILSVELFKIENHLASFMKPLIILIISIGLGLLNILGQLIRFKCNKNNDLYLKHAREYSKIYLRVFRRFMYFLIICVVAIFLIKKYS